MRKADGKIALVREHTVSGYLMGGLNVFIILMGFFFLTLGTHASVVGIIDDFEAGTVGSVFACSSKGL